LGANRNLYKQFIENEFELNFILIETNTNVPNPKIQYSNSINQQLMALNDRDFPYFRMICVASAAETLFSGDADDFQLTTDIECSAPPCHLKLLKWCIVH